MIKWGVEKIKHDRAWFSATLFNSQGPKDDNETPWQMSDFLDEEEEIKVLTEEEQQEKTALECEKWRSWATNCKKGG
jgi:hypothetical protein